MTVCPDCGRRFTGAEMAAEALADIEGRMTALSEDLRVDAAFGRVTGLGDERSMDLLDVTAMAVHPDNTSEPEDEPEVDVHPWLSPRCWPCTLRAERGED